MNKMFRLNGVRFSSSFATGKQHPDGAVQGKAHCKFYNGPLII